MIYFREIKSENFEKKNVSEKLQMLSSQSKEFHIFFAQVNVAAMVFAIFFGKFFFFKISRQLFSVNFASFLHLFD